MSDKRDLEEYVRERLEQDYEVLPLRQSVVTQCYFCDDEATQTDETDDEEVILICDGCADKGQKILEQMWQDVEE